MNKTNKDYKYVKQEFFTGNVLSPEELNYMEDGIYHAVEMAKEALNNSGGGAGNIDLNIENGGGEGAVQQINNEASGEGSAAFGGKLDLMHGTDAEYLDPSYSTEAHGKYAFAANASTRAFGYGTATFGENTEAYQVSSMAVNGASIAGLTEQEFNLKWKDLEVNASINVDDAGNVLTEGAVIVDGEGWDYQRSRSFAFAANELTRAKGRSSTSFGNQTQANGDESFVGGYQSQANALRSFAFGDNVKSNGVNSAVFGQNNEVRGTNGFIVGCGNTGGTNSFVSGLDNSCTSRCLVGGRDNHLQGNSFAFGEGLVGNFSDTILLGRYNLVVEGNPDSPLDQRLWKTMLVIGNGTDNNNRANAVEISKDGLVTIFKDLEVIGNVKSDSLIFNIEKGTGDYAIQQFSDLASKTFDFTGLNTFAYDHTKDESLTGFVQYGAFNKCATTVGGKSAARGSRSFSSGTSTIAHGSYSHTEGSNTVAYGTSTHAEGTGSYAYGEGAHAEGGSYAIGKRSHAEGGQCQALGENSHAEGSITVAETAFSHAEGLKTHAKGEVAHAEGGETLASGNYSHAEGHNTKALGAYSHTEGESVEVAADAQCSHGGGWKTKVNTSYAFGHGAGITVNRECQAVFGQYNETNQNAMFIIGNGSDGKPLNIFEVLSNGDVQFTYNGTTCSLLNLIATLIDKGYVTADNITV